MKWTYYTPGYYVSFMPSDYKWGGWGSFEGRPVFWGLGSEDSNWFELFAGPGEWTRLAFYYLEVRNYGRGGIVLEGRSSPGKWNGYNYVYGMYFRYLGTKWASGAGGYAGVFLVNSRNNVIKNNHFVHLENVGENQGGIHAVYMKNWATNNLIRDNSMSYISGDAVRVRNESNDNDIRANVLYRTGEAGQYSDFYQDKSDECTDSPDHERQECPSWRNWFRYNTVGCGYDGTEISYFYFYGKKYATQSEKRDCVPSACTDYGDDRVATASNTENCP